MKRRQNGLHLIELSVGMMVLIPIVLYGIDIACIYFAGSYNSSLCRDACRAAAAGPPTIYCTSNPMLAPNARAKRVIAGRFDPHSIIRVSATPVLTETIRDPKPIAPWGGPVQGEVTVQTEVTVNPPFNLPAIAPVVLLKTESSFPITWVMQPTYRGSDPMKTLPILPGKPREDAPGITDKGSPDAGTSQLK